jgi:hypothetical protein
VLASRNRTNRRPFLSGHSAWMLERKGKLSFDQEIGLGQAGFTCVP